MNNGFKILSVIVIIWILVTLIFVQQHSVEYREADINEIVPFKDFTVKLDRVTVYNFKPKPPNFKQGRIISKLPSFLRMPYSKLSYLYSAPYYKDNSYYRTALFGSLTLSKPLNQVDNYYEYIDSNIEFKVIDSKGVDYSNSLETMHNTNSRVIEFRIKDRKFPIGRMQKGFQIVVKDKLTGKEEAFTVEGSDFIAHKENDSFHQIGEIRELY